MKVNNNMKDDTLESATSSKILTPESNKTKIMKCKKLKITLNCKKHLLLLRFKKIKAIQESKAQRLAHLFQHVVEHAKFNREDNPKTKNSVYAFTKCHCMKDKNKLNYKKASIENIFLDRFSTCYFHQKKVEVR